MRQKPGQGAAGPSRAGRQHSRSGCTHSHGMHPSTLLCCVPKDAHAALTIGASNRGAPPSVRHRPCLPFCACSPGTVLCEDYRGSSSSWGHGSATSGAGPPRGPGADGSAVRGRGCRGVAESGRGGRAVGEREWDRAGCLAATVGCRLLPLGAGGLPGDAPAGSDPGIAGALRTGGLRAAFDIVGVLAQPRAGAVAGAVRRRPGPAEMTTGARSRACSPTSLVLESSCLPRSRSMRSGRGAGGSLRVSGDGWALDVRPQPIPPSPFTS